MKFVVTGALGHIGSKLIRDLADFSPNCDIVMIDNMITQRYSSLFNLPKNAKYKFIEEDLLTADLTKYFQNADAVIHLGAITDATSSLQKKDLVEQNNMGATQKVAAACITNKAPLIFSSTTSVYGTQSEIVDETCSGQDLRPQSPYAETKLKEENYLKELYQKSGLKLIICRFGTIFGTSPGMRFHTAVNKFCWQACMGTPLTVWKTALNQRRPYLDLDDCVRAIKHIITNKIYDGEVYNVLTLNATVSEIIDPIKQNIPGTEIVLVENQIMNQLSYHVMSEKFSKKGFKATGNLADQIASTIRLLRP